MSLWISWHASPGKPLEWFDGQGDHPKFANELGLGPLGTVEAVLAHTRESHTGIKRGARMIAARARVNLAMHRDTGAARIGIEKSPPHQLDWVVYLEDRDPGGGGKNRTGKRSALSIEFGHLFTAPDGTVKRIGGLFVLTGAAQSAARAPGRRLS